MGAVSALILTAHPFQRTGAWAVTALSKRQDPNDVTDSDLDAMEGRIINDEVKASVTPKGGDGYAWWKVLFNFFPNSATTHASRERDAEALTKAMKEMFTPDETATETWPCTYCGRRAGAVWGKTGLQLVASERLLNTAPPGIAGWPVCRPCRIASRALPYGAALAPAVASVLTAEDEEIERRSRQHHETPHFRKEVD